MNNHHNIILLSPSLLLSLIIAFSFEYHYKNSFAEILTINQSESNIQGETIEHKPSVLIFSVKNHFYNLLRFLVLIGILIWNRKIIYLLLPLGLIVFPVWEYLGRDAGLIGFLLVCLIATDIYKRYFFKGYKLHLYFNLLILIYAIFTFALTCLFLFDAIDYHLLDLNYRDISWEVIENISRGNIILQGLPLFNKFLIEYLIFNLLISFVGAGILWAKILIVRKYIKPKKIS